MNPHTRVLLNLTNEGHLAIHTGMDAFEGCCIERAKLVLAGNRLHCSTSMEDPRQLQFLEERAGWWLPGMDEGNQGIAGLLTVWTKEVL